MIQVSRDVTKHLVSRELLYFDSPEKVIAGRLFKGIELKVFYAVMLEFQLQHRLTYKQCTEIAAEGRTLTVATTFNKLQKHIGQKGGQTRDNIIRILKDIIANPVLMSSGTSVSYSAFFTALRYDKVKSSKLEIDLGRIMFECKAAVYYPSDIHKRLKTIGYDEATLRLLNKITVAAGVTDNLSFCKDTFFSEISGKIKTKIKRNKTQKALENFVKIGLIKSYTEGDSEVIVKVNRTWYKEEKPTKPKKLSQSDRFKQLMVK